MKLWLLTQEVNTGYDTYDSMVVAATTEAKAKLISPSDSHEWGLDYYRNWAKDPSEVTAECIGTALRGTKEGVILASFHAG